MALTDRTLRLSESELSARYTSAAHRFAEISNWRDYIALAEEFHVLDTYKDSAQLYVRCIKAASAPAYREITEKIASGDAVGAEEFREAARIMQLIQDYQDARELMRVYTLKANALMYTEAVELLSNADATTQELGRGVELLRQIKTYRDSREKLERFEKYYFERMYAEGLLLMENGRVYSEFEEAAEIFEKISVYSDAAAQAAACRKRANKLRPKSKKVKETAPDSSKDEAVRVKKPPAAEEQVSAPRRRKRIDDETHSLLTEVWRTMDKRHMGAFIVWIVVLILDMYASIVLPGLEYDFFVKYANETRGVTAIIAIFAAVMAVRTFLRMLTASMRQKLGKAALRTLQKLAAPLIKAVNKILQSIGIDLARRGRLGGRDEKSIIRDDEEKVKKPKKRIKNDLKWQEMPDNAARIRFIFIDYMIRHIKNGYFMKHSMTPAEIGRELATEDDEAQLFAVYDKARYGGNRAVEEITDALIGEMQAINRRRSS